MLALKIEIEGDRWRDLELALEEVVRLVKDENIWGLDGNDTGNYTFRVTGEEKEDSDDEQEEEEE